MKQVTTGNIRRIQSQTVYNMISVFSGV